MNWPKILSANSGRLLKPDEAKLWYSELKRELRHFDDRAEFMNDDELCNAIRYAYSAENKHVRKPHKLDLTKNNLRIWVCMWRKARSLADDPDAGLSEQDRRIKELKAQIRQTTDPIEIWNIICTPNWLDGWDESACNTLEEYAMRIHPGWSRPVAYINKLLAEITNMVSQAPINRNSGTVPF